MSHYVSAAAFAASRTLTAQGLKVKRSHLSEIIAALLGYHTYAALAVEEADSSLDYHLEDAEILVLNVPMGTMRAEDLGFSDGQASAPIVTQACVDALKAEANSTNVYVSIEEFYDEYARQALAEAIYTDDDVASAMAECNAYFPDEPDMPIACPPVEDLWSAVKEWSIQADGGVTGEYDPDGDRLFNGDQLQCWGRLVYDKAGRAGLVFVYSEAAGGLDDSWRDEDGEDELEYLQSVDRA